MSYRGVKRILGETSLERKCRFLFGGALMLLISASFYLYSQRSMRIIEQQHRERAQLIISQDLVALHWSAYAGDTEAIPGIEELNTELKPVESRNLEWKFIPENYEENLLLQPDYAENEALRAIRNGADYYTDEQPADSESEGAYHYYEPIYATSTTCTHCHESLGEVFEVGALMGVAKLSFNLVDTQREVAKNNAILIVAALVTSFLAMLAAYAIVRYVIVKPVLHLKEVSEAIAHGDLDQRADINTGDEFEELSHSYNRMLRHLVDAQGELRQTNNVLDAKVDELAQANLSLHEMNKLKNEFLATMSHELRTPLNSILGFSDVLVTSDNLNDRQKKYVHNIQRSGNDLLVLVNDILDLAKIEAGKMELRLAEFDPRELADNLVLSMRPLAERKSIELTSVVDPTLTSVQQDAGKLQQILTNLLSNAVKFTPEGGRVRLRVERAEDSYFDCIVEDTGIGIPLEDQTKIFDKFRQGRNLSDQQDPLTREYGGTGLGLSIVNELSRLLGGSVFLESEFGKGSVFSVRLPIWLRVLETRGGERENPLQSGLQAPANADEALETSLEH
jgi:two-component system sensor histidine kinase BarA